ncbi:TonB-dependent receptor [Runella rosea]|uniref:TonB-dependent receptor n=1 Tax=Runella rosea TaxID=2259595 RepID=UPI00196584E7|nr:TonB-dependent receptor [Runella rosea]
MDKILRNAILYSMAWLMSAGIVLAQTKVAGNVTDATTRDGLVGVSIQVKGKVVGTISDAKGNFSLTTNTPAPFILVVTSVGFETQEVQINGDRMDLKIVLKEQALIGQEVVVSASRVEESVLKSPVSIEKMDIRNVRETPAANFYDAIRNLKGVEVSTQSLMFSSVNTRGFSGNGNTRVVQMIDGIDNQAPGLNFAVGNIVGISELDLESVELLPGSASALYGPNAINGLLLMNSKNPFLYQGVSAYTKLGLMSADNRSTKTTPFYDVAFRYAKAFNNKFAFKLNVGYITAQDWQVNDYRDQSFRGTTPDNGTRSNPGYDGVNVYGDENSSGAGLASLRGTFGQLLGVPLAQLNAISAPLAQLVGGINQFSTATGIPSTQLINDILLPNVAVSRTGYNEFDLVNYNTKSLKLNGALHYRINDKVEAIVQANWGAGSTVYTSSDRYQLKNFTMGLYKAELRGSNFFVRGYMTAENSGDTYAAGLLGTYINEAWKPSVPPASAGLAGLAQGWYPQYALTYAGGAFQTFVPAFQAALRAGQTPQAAYATALGTVNSNAGALHTAARGVADQGRVLPGDPRFDQIAAQVKANAIPSGALFVDRTRLYHAEAMYNFNELIDPKVVEIIVGGNYRKYALNSNGTLFLKKSDGSEFSINEFGGYTQVSKNFNDVFKLTGSVRYDKNENFAGQWSPRISAVYTANKNHNIRASYQTGFRIPTNQNQYINLNTPVSLLIGGLPALWDNYKLREGGGSVNIATGQAWSFPEFKPERALSFEVGYKGMIAKKLLVDVYYYNTTMKNYIGGVLLRNAAIPQVISMSTNYTGDIKTQGFGLGFDYLLPKNYTLGFNLSNNTLDAGGVKMFSSEKNRNVLDDGFQVGYNTPKYRHNVTFGNRNLGNSGWGFNVVWRHQAAFDWLDLLQPALARQPQNSTQLTIPAFGTLDAQVSKKVSSIKSIFKIGGTNLLGTQYRTGWGNPVVGSMYYVSLTFDELLNK